MINVPSFIAEYRIRGVNEVKFGETNHINTWRGRWTFLRVETVSCKECMHVEFFAFVGDDKFFWTKGSGGEEAESGMGNRRDSNNKIRV